MWQCQSMLFLQHKQHDVGELSDTCTELSLCFYQWEHLYSWLGQPKLLQRAFLNLENYMQTLQYTWQFHGHTGTQSSDVSRLLWLIGLASFTLMWLIYTWDTLITKIVNGVHYIESKQAGICPSFTCQKLSFWWEIRQTFPLLNIRTIRQLCWR